jgi:hypothetical protein
VENISPEERHRVQIVVMLSEDPWDQQMETKILNGSKKIMAQFGKEIMEGLLEVIAAPKEWFVYIYKMIKIRRTPLLPKP